MNRVIVMLALAGAAGSIAAAPLGAQGRSGRQTRTYVDARGRECRETRHLKKNGSEKYEVKCKQPKRGTRYGQRDDYAYDDDYMYGTRRYPTTLPDMVGAVIWGRGQRPMDVSRWVGGDGTRVTYVDGNRDGRPERASWLDRDGRLFQQWLDTNGDGRADAVRFYRDGRIVKVIGG